MQDLPKKPVQVSQCRQDRLSKQAQADREWLPRLRPMDHLVTQLFLQQVSVKLFHFVRVHDRWKTLEHEN